MNGGSSVLVDQPDTGSGDTILSVPVKLNLNSGSNMITFGAGQSNYAGDLDKIIVYPPTSTSSTGTVGSSGKGSGSLTTPTSTGSAPAATQMKYGQWCVFYGFDAVGYVADVGVCSV